jgi:tyrosine-protein phosphatase SIW14
MDQQLEKQQEHPFGLDFGDMALKRNSRVFVEDGARADEMQQRTVPAPYRSRRNSRSSAKEDKLLNAMDLEDVQRNGIIIRETSTITRSQAGVVISKELSVGATTASRGEKTTEQMWAMNSEAPADWTVDQIGARSSSLPSRPMAEWSSEFPSVPVADRPTNFGVVIPGVYRSSYPKPDDYEFIKGLKLKTMV